MMRPCAYENGCRTCGTILILTSMHPIPTHFVRPRPLHSGMCCAGDSRKSQVPLKRALTSLPRESTPVLLSFISRIGGVTPATLCIHATMAPHEMNPVDAAGDSNFTSDASMWILLSIRFCKAQSTARFLYGQNSRLSYSTSSHASPHEIKRDPKV